MIQRGWHPQWEAEPILLPFKDKVWKFHVSFLHISMSHSLGHTRTNQGRLGNTIRLKVTGAIIREGRSGCWGRQNCCCIIILLGASWVVLTVTLTHLLGKLTVEHSFLIIFFIWQCLVGVILAICPALTTYALQLPTFLCVLCLRALVGFQTDLWYVLLAIL